MTILCLALAALPVGATTNGPVCVVTVREDISHNTLFLIRRAVREAAAQDAAALIVELDTNGGRVDATEDIIRTLEHAPFKTFAFVNQKAYSAGAFIAAGTDKIFMAPGSVIGAATPVMMMPGQGVQALPKSYEEKISSAMRALIRSTAQQNGHNPDVFEAMVDADAGLVMDGKTITEKGKLLTLTDQEAARVYGLPARALLSAGTVKSVDELLGKVGLAGAGTFTVAPFGFEVLGRWISAIAPLLILVGMVAIYIEIKTPGIGVPALVAVVCFGLYFIGNYAAGLAGWEDVVLFIIGVGLLAAEVFVIPGFGVVGVLGILFVLASLVLGMTQRLPGTPLWPQWADVQWPLLKVAFSFSGSVVVMALLARWLPETRLFKRVELTTTSPVPAAVSGVPVGATGVAETMLRPAGKGRFGEALVDVVTEGDLIEKGAAIRVAEVAGNRVVVRRV